MYTYNLLKTFFLFTVFSSVLGDFLSTDDVKNRSKRTVGLFLSGLSNFLNVHDDLQVTTPISITTSAPNYNKRPPPPKVQKWPPLDFEITPYVLSLISAKKPSNPTPTEVPPTEEPYYHAQVFFVPLRDLENQLNNQYEQQKVNPNSYAYNGIGQQLQQSLPNGLLYADSVSRNRLIPERYAQKHVQQPPPHQSNHQTNNKPLSNNRQSTNSTTKKKQSLQQKDIDEILEKLTSIFANPHDGQVSRIAGNDVSNDKTQYMSFIDQEPRLGYNRQQAPEKNKDLLNFYLLERMQRIQNNANSIRIPTSVNNVVKNPKSNPTEETKVEIIKSVEPEMIFTTDSEVQSHKSNSNTNPAKGVIGSQIDNKHYDKEAPVAYDIARSLEFPIPNGSSKSNSAITSNVEGDDGYSSRSSFTPTEGGGHQTGEFRNVENGENSPIQIHFSPGIEFVKNYDREGETHVTRKFPNPATGNYDESHTPRNYQQPSFIGYQGYEDIIDPFRSNVRGEFRYPVPFDAFGTNPKTTQTVDSSAIFKDRNRHYLNRSQRPNSKIKLSFNPNLPFSSPVNGPENQHKNYNTRNPKQETQVHFFLPDEDSLREPEQFSKPPVPNKHNDDSKTVDDYQYQRDAYYQNSQEDFGSFPYQLGSGGVDSKYPIPKAIHSPKLPDDIHDELYNSISRSHHGPPPAFDQDIAKSELRSKAVHVRQGRQLFTPNDNHKNFSIR
ncbi:uncharacterized protein LOC120349957 [Nilaparvata lugens]|uniref:uncharacterized protein LOC120349957 n=1 Tax=Nilaparvata lugens TaxID=108931 RepID=UPI00193E97C1|nr:uncharacterized protein LOC120349957 [Nilaparvata lugens]